MAEGFANYYGKSWVEASSAGTHPAGYISPHAISAMEEKGIDIASLHSRGLSRVNWDLIDWTIVLELSIAPQVREAARGTEVTLWMIPDPVGQSVEFFRGVRDQIELKVLDLVDEVRREQ
jgi:arsenate reductase